MSASRRHKRKIAKNINADKTAKVAMLQDMLRETKAQLAAIATPSRFAYVN